MDLRSFVPGRAGVEFELQQLSACWPRERVVLVVDERSRPAARDGMVTILREHTTLAETGALFDTLVRAAYDAGSARTAAL
jgi:hypothetical protein